MSFILSYLYFCKLSPVLFWEEVALNKGTVLGVPGSLIGGTRALCLCHTVGSWSVTESGGPFIDQVYVLQGYAEGWKEGSWEEKVDDRPCIDPPLYSQDKHEYYRCGCGLCARPGRA